MKTFSIQTLGCKVNQYESEQIATLLKSRGLSQVQEPAGDLRIINTCSVTIQAASKSRQTIRQTTRSAISLNVIQPNQFANQVLAATPINIDPSHSNSDSSSNPRVIVTGCWATSDKTEAAAMPGVDAVITHHDDVAAELNRFLFSWNVIPTAQITAQEPLQNRNTGDAQSCITDLSPELGAYEEWIKKARTLADEPEKLKAGPGATSLPLLGQRHSGHQRAFLKVQDGCDAHCTYCIIPTLRPRLWSKPTDAAVEEANRLVAAGHSEIILTGIFLGAYGQPTALRRRQPDPGKSIAELIDALCTRVSGLRRLRLSSLEPGDLTPTLLATLRSHEQIVPHFHLPLQSGSDFILRRMNRQYTRDQFLKMIDGVHAAFDRPALTTDIIVGFPGESDAEFDQTLEIVDRAEFIHTHAFSFSPRPGTAAARWSKDYIRGPVVNHRIDILRQRAIDHSFTFRQSFVGEAVEILVEQTTDTSPANSPSLKHGRCERYFEVHFESNSVHAGDSVQVRIDHITPTRTFGVPLT